MSFCNFSTEYVASSQTEIDNIFISEYMPYADSDYVKVYLFGLYMCKSGTQFDNNIESFAARLNMTKEQVEAAFTYWEEQGLVKVLKTYPIEVRYIPLKNVLTSTRLFNPEKYATFNSQAQELFAGKREISKTEYGEYYDFLERYHVEEEALLMIMKYCIDNKQRAVSYNYILTVAKNWANEGIVTASQVEEKLQSFEQKDSEIGLILKALGIKRNAYIEERNMLNKWLLDFGFNLDTILYVAKGLKKKNKASFSLLDEKLLKYYESKLFSVLEIEEFENNKQALYDLAKNINRAIGVYYESLDSVVETYILRWINMGFDKEILIEFANHCFKNSIRTLEGMDNVVKKFFKMGIVNMSAYNQYLSEVISFDTEIAKILNNLSLQRKVNYLDRENYKTWTNEWQMPQELIDYACTLACGKNMPMQYLGKILANWHEKGIKTIDKAKNCSLPVFNNVKNENFKGRSYQQDSTKALFQSLEEVEIGGDDE